MKKILKLLVLLSTNLFYSQSGAAYQQLKPLNNDVSSSLQYWGALQSQQNELNSRLAEARREANYKRFAEYRDLAFLSIKENKPENCIFYYENSRNLGFYDPDFEYIAGVSYMDKYRYSNDKSDIKRAVKLLKLAKRHGKTDAKIMIEYIKNTFK